MSIFMTGTVLAQEHCKPVLKSILEKMLVKKKERASARLAQTSQKNQRFWRLYSEAFQSSTKQYLEKRLDVYLRAKKLKHPHVLFLENLGIVFNTDKVIVPELRHIMDVMEEQIDRIKNLSHMDENQIIRPKLFIKMKDSLTNQDFSVHVPFGADIYRGHNLATFIPILNDGTSVFTNKKFYSLLSQGDFILGGLDPILLSTTDLSLNIILHDLAHISGFYRVPSFMQNLRMAAGSILDMAQTTKLNRFLSSESAYIIKPTSDKELAKWLGLPQGMLDDPSLDQLKNIYSKLGPVKVKLLQKSILKSLFDYVSPLGGGTSDVLSAFGGANEFPLQKAYLPLQYLGDKGPAFEGAWQAARDISNSDILAYFAHFIILSRDIKPEDWAVLLRSRQGEEPKVFQEIYHRIPVDPNHPLWILRGMNL